VRKADAFFAAFSPLVHAPTSQNTIVRRLDAGARNALTKHSRALSSAAPGSDPSQVGPATAGFPVTLETATVPPITARASARKIA